MLKKLSKEEENKICDEIIGYFKNQRDEDLGIIQASEFLEFMIDCLGKRYYNFGLDDALGMFREKIQAIDFEVEEMKF